MKLNNLLGEFRSSELAAACRSLALLVSGTKGQRIERLVALTEEPNSGVDSIDVLASLPEEAQEKVLEALSIAIELETGTTQTLANLVGAPNESLANDQARRSMDADRLRAQSDGNAQTDSAPKPNDRIRSCSDCGTPFDVEARLKYCGSCGTSLAEIDPQFGRRGQTPEYRNEQQHLSNREAGRNRTGTRSRSPSARAWIYAIIGIVVGLVAGVLANIIVSAIGVAASGADTIGDLPAGWTFLRLLAALGATVWGGVLGYRMGSR
jgi:hypothetical protein